MQLRCIRDFSQYRAAHLDEDGNQVPADTEEVPDGAAFDPFHWEAVGGAPPEDDPPADPAPASLDEALAAVGLPTTAPPVQFPHAAPKEM